MTDVPKKLSETARAVLTLAATRPDHLMRPPQLPIAAARQVVRSLLKGGLVEEVAAPIQDAAYLWRTTEGGAAVMLQATALGLARVDEADGTRQNAAATDEPAPTSVQPSDGAPAPTAPIRANLPTALRQTAQALLDAWDDPTNRETANIGALDGPFAALRAALAAHAVAPVNSSRQPKDTKQARVLAMLRREQGASGPAIAEAMGWAPHTVRGFLAGLSKKGIMVEVLDRVRQVGPNKAGAKGSYTVYRVTE